MTPESRVDLETLALLLCKCLITSITGLLGGGGGSIDIESTKVVYSKKNPMHMSMSVCARSYI